MSKKPIEDYFEDHARSGNSEFAIAYALMQVAKSTDQVAASLQRLGNGDAATQKGAIEELGSQIEKAAQIIADRG